MISLSNKDKYCEIKLNQNFEPKKERIVQELSKMRKLVFWN